LEAGTRENNQDGGADFAEVRAGAFSVTRWTLVVDAAGTSPGAAEALEQLCGRYWYPIYAFVRRRGSDHHQAEDLTQGFFAFLLEKEILKKADRTRGKFRTFLLATLANFLANEWDKQQSLKRGGRIRIVSLDETVAEGLYHREPVETLTPEKLFERRWAFALLEQALARLKQDYLDAGKEEVFVKLEPALTGATPPGWYGGCAASLGMSENAVRVALHRLRRRFGELLRETIAPTVGDPGEVEDEVRHLFAALSP
jgi:RNA polymerase sigma factor (sigma-70 family)